MKNVRPKESWEKEPPTIESWLNEKIEKSNGLLQKGFWESKLRIYKQYRYFNNTPERRIVSAMELFKVLEENKIGGDVLKGSLITEDLSSVNP
jgi:hypothetical protein